MYSETLRPGTRLGSYPEKETAAVGRVDKLVFGLSGLLRRLSNRAQHRATRFLSDVNAQQSALQALDESSLAARVAVLRKNLRREGIQEELAVEAFALVRESAHREIGMRHYDTQIVGGWLLLHGMLAEMETGEGKTLVATLPACTAALAGIPVHVVTANDYLVQRDAELMVPVYRMLGLNVGTVTESMTDPEQRRQAYACDVTYCTSKQIAFDYLRDRVAMGQRRSQYDRQLDRLRSSDGRSGRMLLRGLCYAIVDEADSVLIDQARTPLILSQSTQNAPDPDLYERALKLALQLQEKRHFDIRRRDRAPELTPSGVAWMEQNCGDAEGVWKDPRRRRRLMQQALSALHLYQRDRDYLVRDGAVHIVDANTGRVLPDHSWELGLQQLIEAKEACTLSPRKQTLARTSYQRFFRRYLRLSGMTGTASEVARELWSLYGLQVVRVPTHRPLRRRRGTEQYHATAAQKWAAVVEDVDRVHTAGRPVLVGTRSVAASEHLSVLLTQIGLRHEVLNAHQDRREADIIAAAGNATSITVATNMAGRGTDIRLGPGVAENGGLYVIATERNEARRIDRQLFGRCGRQGDPGCFGEIVSLEDELPQAFLPSTILRLTISLRKLGLPVSGRMLMGLAQRLAENHDARQRRDLVKYDEQMQQSLAFTGPLY